MSHGPFHAKQIKPIFSSGQNRITSSVLRRDNSPQNSNAKYQKNLNSTVHIWATLYQDYDNLRERENAILFRVIFFWFFGCGALIFGFMIYRMRSKKK
jgi:hypothetical protein